LELENSFLEEKSATIYITILTSLNAPPSNALGWKYEQGINGEVSDVKFDGMDGGVLVRETYRYYREGIGDDDGVDGDDDRVEEMEKKNGFLKNNIFIRKNDQKNENNLFDFFEQNNSNHTEIDPSPSLPTTGLLPPETTTSPSQSQPTLPNTTSPPSSSDNTSLTTKTPIKIKDTIIPLSELSPTPIAYTRTRNFVSEFFFKLTEIPETNAALLSSTYNLTLLLHGPATLVIGKEPRCYVNGNIVPVMGREIQKITFLQIELHPQVMNQIKRSKNLTFWCKSGELTGISIRRYGWSGQPIQTLAKPSIEYRLTPTDPDKSRWVGFIDPIRVDPDDIKDDDKFTKFAFLLAFGGIFILGAILGFLAVLTFVFCLGVKLGAGWCCKAEVCISIDQRLSKHCICYPCKSHVAHNDAQDALLIIHDDQYASW